VRGNGSCAKVKTKKGKNKMKKIMIAIAAVAIAAVSQAAVVNWQVGSFTGPGADGKGWGKTLIGGEGYTATLLVSASIAGDAEKGYKLGELIKFDSGDVLEDDDIADGYGWGITSDSLADDTTYYAQVILEYKDSTLTSQIVSFETSALSGSADPAFGLGEEVAFVSALPGEKLDSTYGVFKAAGWQTAAVPEPTSGLLLLLGMAGLALRRKQA
jgi:hypothetical protein